jgi:glycosyltransferase involved in cell wall biosynthesis
MRLAFYAPLKPPEHPVPSGDRAMARALMAALAYSGAQVDLAAEFPSRDGVGDAAVQARLTEQAQALVPEIIAQGRRAGWAAWVSYHCYYKAPDLLGPSVSAALGIPYLLVEATRARKRLGGPWDAFARSSEAACDAAACIFYLTERDHEALKRDAPNGQSLIRLPPFLSRTELPVAAWGSHFLAVGMMRIRAKLASYELIAQTLMLLPGGPDLEIAGDGPARGAVEAAMAPLGARVRFLGALEPEELADAYARAGALIWPGVDEAFGVTYLEAQAHGLPVIAQDRPGVRDVLYPRDYPEVASGAEGLAQFSREPRPAARSIRKRVQRLHLLPAAAATLRAGLTQAGVR